MRDIRELQYFQALPLEVKVRMTEIRIRGWYEHFNGDVYVSLSGGKDSRVLLDIARRLYPTIPAMFVDTGLEYPEVREFAKSFDNVDVVRPTMRFDEVIKKYGYPVIGKEIARKLHYAKQGAEWALKYVNNASVKNGKISAYCIGKWQFLLNADFNVGDDCCNIMKKKPSVRYSKETHTYPIIATMAEESRLRKNHWRKYGCNAFDSKKPISTPMSFWTEQDVLKYIYDNELSIANVYGEVVCEDDIYRTTGVDRTGCIFCCFGIQRDKFPNRFQRLKETHPKQWNYCINGGEYVGGLWQPNQKGLGLSHVLDYIGVPYE